MIEQKRILATSIPGPASQALQQRKVAAVAAGVSTGLPVYVTEASGGILRDADGNQLIDFGSGIAVTTVGNGNQRIIDAVTAVIGEVEGDRPDVARVVLRQGVEPLDAPAGGVDQAAVFGEHARDGEPDVAGRAGRG